MMQKYKIDFLECNKKKCKKKDTILIGIKTENDKRNYKTLLDLVFARQMELLALGLYESDEYTRMEEIKVWLRSKIRKP